MTDPSAMANSVGVKRTGVLPVATLFSLTLFFFTPVQICLTNRFEFPYRFLQILPYFVIISFFVALFLAAALRVLPVSLRKRSSAFIFILASLIWLQGNVFVWDYGVFDGREIDWDKFSAWGFVDAALWLTGVSFAIFKSEQIYRNARKWSFGLIVIQLVSAFWLMGQASELSGAEKFKIKTDTLFDFSSKKNIILLVLDAFQSDVFQEIIDENISAADDFTGFTYFRDALSGFPGTYPSVTAILTGRYYDNSLGIQKFIKDEFMRLSLPGVLRDHGFRVEMYPFFNPLAIYWDPRVASNLALSKKTIKGPDIAYIYDVALFRAVPHVLKKIIYQDQKWLLRRTIFNSDKKKLSRFDNRHLSHPARDSFWNGNMKFFKENHQNMSKKTDADIFKYIHLMGMHPPISFNESLQNESLPYDRGGYKRQAAGLLKLVGLYLFDLKKSGVYDNSMIFVIGDHGAMGDVYISKGVYDNNVIGGALPLVLIKPFNAHGAMRVSEAPVSLSDIPKTVASELGVTDDFPGASMFTLNSSDKRLRHFYSFDWGQQKLQEEFLPMLTEYEVDGPGWSSGSWHATGRELFPAGKVIRQPVAFLKRIRDLIMGL